MAITWSTDSRGILDIGGKREVHEDARQAFSDLHAHGGTLPWVDRKVIASIVRTAIAAGWPPRSVLPHVRFASVAMLRPWVRQSVHATWSDA